MKQITKKKAVSRAGVGVLLIIIIMTLLISPAAAAGRYDSLEVYPGGMTFGVKFMTDGVYVVGFCDVVSGGRSSNPAIEAGLRQHDVITSVNGIKITSAKELADTVDACKGAPVTLSVKRGGNIQSVTITPVFSSSEERYKTGIWVRDSGAGIGTVTFIVPQNNAFAGLGHGICDSETGALVEMQRGSVSDVTISGIQRGADGMPGELKGYFNTGKTGALINNTECGVYGIFTAPPSKLASKIKIASKDQVHDGDATLLCALDSGEIRQYQIKISAINRAATGSKCFSVNVVDKDLIEKTGGIVQGMSGSPIIQDGRLVGAVTHVLVNNPRSGYGIFAENMLDAMPELLK